MLILNPPITVPGNPSKTYTQLDGTFDYSNVDKFFAITLNQNGQRIVLWSGPDYDAAGQWTDDQSYARLDVLVRSTNPLY